MRPKDWKPAIVTPVFKSGNVNYRPISILPLVSKIAERCVADQLLVHLNNTPAHRAVWLQRQPFHWHCHLLFYWNCKIQDGQGDVVGAVFFLDLKRASDTINHNVLVSKLSRFSFSPDAVKWITSYLDHRTQGVRVKNELFGHLANEVSTLMTCHQCALGVKFKCTLSILWFMYMGRTRKKWLKNFLKL